jgi:RsiW-degrading membrane proteinase PrsW (M82 family)
VVRLLAFIPLVAVVAVLVVILCQWAAEWIHHAGIGAARYAALGPGGGKATLGRIVLWIAAYIIGWGYSRSLEPDSFVEHIFSFSLGAGVVEKLIKGFAGLFFFFFVLRGYSQDKYGCETKSVPRTALAFTLAGLSFGAGEAIFYFQVYSSLGSEPSIYILRAVWCVLLHGTWSFLTGVLFGVVDSPGGPPQSDAVAWAMLVGSLLPAVLLHGIYDACCVHSVTAMWVTGGLCLGAGLLGMLLFRVLSKTRLQQARHAV